MAVAAGFRTAAVRAAPLPLVLRLPPLPRPAAAALLTLAALLSGCERFSGSRVPQLTDARLPRLEPAALQACAQRLGLAPELPRPADPTNFGERQTRDARGRTVPHEPALIVLHETVISAPATVTLFATPQPDDDSQASYHLLIDRQGRRLRIVPDELRAFGAGMSAFGDFAVRIRPTSVGSINNVALHLSVETPADGRGDTDGHSGYTPAQYEAAAAQVLLWQARFGIPFSRLTTHAAVDRSRSRYDPRSFRWERFLPAYRKAAEACSLTAYDNGRAIP